MIKEFSANINTIPTLAKLISNQLKGGEVLALIGDLGSGKTTFTKALGKELKIKTKIVSPTFVLMNEHKGILPKLTKKVNILHLDLYRTNSIKEITALGLFELWNSKNTITIVEWANKIKRYLPKNTIIINFFHE